jgi:hypothetical protein
MPTAIASSHDGNGGYSLYPSTNSQAEYLWDGSLIFLVNDGASLILYRIASPGAGSPSATSIQSFAVPGAGGGSIHNGDLYVADDGAGGSDVWVGYAENNNAGGAYVQHAVFDSGGSWTWDTATSVHGNGFGTVNQISLVWTGTYVVALMRATTSGAVYMGINYTSTKNATSGWQATLVQLSSTAGGGSHYFGELHHDDTLGCIVAVYSLHGETLQSRVLPDSSSPALVNWGPETDLGVGTIALLDFQGHASLLDHTTGRMHVLYYDNTTGAAKNPGYVTGTITVNGTSSAVTWASPFQVGTRSDGNDSPTLAVDGSGKVFAFWSSNLTGSSADVLYATIDSPYTSASAQTNLTNAANSRNNHPMTPRRQRSTAGYIPLFYLTGTASPYTVNYDNSIAAATGGSSIEGAASLSADGNLTVAGAVLYGGASSLSANGNLSAAAVMLYGGRASLSADANMTARAVMRYAAAAALASDGNLSVAAAKLLKAAATLPADANLTSAAQRTAGASATLSADGNLSARAVMLMAAAALLVAQANLSATATVANPNFTAPTGVIALQAAIEAIAALQNSIAAVIVLQSTPEGTVS